MKHNFWKLVSPLDAFLILLNCVLLLLLFTAGGCQSTDSNSLLPTAQRLSAEPMPALQPAAGHPEAPPPAFTADDAGFIAAMLAP
jgi:hypothetical protein